MRILLLSMPDITPSSADSMLLPWLGIASLAGNINLDENNIQIADLVLRRKDYRKFLSDLLSREKYDLVGLSGMTCSVQTAIEIARFIKENFPHILIVFGGFMALCHDDELVQPDIARWIDFLVRGEAEMTFNELINTLQHSNDYQKINGISYKINGEFHHTLPRQLADLSRIKLPNRQARILKRGFHFWGQPADVVETSRGCTFDCSFCCVTRQYGRVYREYALDRVLTDIEKVYALGTRFIVLVDDNITLDIKRLDALCDDLIKARFRNLKFFAQAAVKPIANNPDLVKKMRQAGFELVFLGLENLIERNLKFLNKKTSGFELAKKAIHSLKQEKIITSAGIIMGNPEDSAEDLWQNYQLIRELKVDLPNFMTLTPFPGTKIREELEQQGLLTNPTDYKRYDLIQANVKTKFLSDQELFRLVKLFFRKYYFSWKFILFNRMLRRHLGYAVRYTLNEGIDWFRKKLHIKKFPPNQFKE